MGKSKVVERWRKTPPPPGIVVIAVVVRGYHWFGYSDG